jgi:hypothetical protein
MRVKYKPELSHWRRWQPEILQQQLTENRLVYPFLFGVKIEGFAKNQWPIVSIDSLATNIVGRSYREGDCLTDKFLLEKLENSNPTFNFVTLRGDKVIEKWYETVVRTIMLQFEYKEIPTGFQPEEIEYAGKFRRNISIHYLSFNLESIREVVLKKAIPLSLGHSSLETLTSSINITTVSFNPLSYSYGI